MDKNIISELIKLNKQLSMLDDSIIDFVIKERRNEDYSWEKIGEEFGKSTGWARKRGEKLNLPGENVRII